MRREKRVHAGAPDARTVCTSLDCGLQWCSVVFFGTRQRSHAPRAVGRACVARGEILTFPDTPTTQGLSLWCFNTVSQ